MKPADGAEARVVAARILSRVVGEGRSLSTALPDGLMTLQNDRDRSFVQAICYGVLRDYETLDIVLEGLLDRSIRRRDVALRCLLLVGIHQIASMNVPDHAAVSATVNAVTGIGKRSARGMVNAVLRRFTRDGESAWSAARNTPVGRYAHPKWMISRLRDDWPDDWQQVLEAGREPPPMWLRVNRRDLSAEEYLTCLSDDEAALGEHASESIRLGQPVDVQKLPGFAEGQVSVQDAGAQIAAHLVAPRSGQRILDACAAPGGKTCHLLELCPDARVTAVDSSAERMERVRENLSRLKLDATLLVADARETDAWWDGRSFDSILLDAPCSATGVIRRHPDIKLLRRSGDIAQLATLQAALLSALWPLLRPGGRIVYCTCSVLREEGVDQVDRWVRQQSDAAIESIPARWGRDLEPGRQILTGEAGMDGFYYACLVKQD